MFEVYNHRIDWIDHFTGEKSFDLVTETVALKELREDYLNQIVSITRIIDEEGNESENLIESFRKKLSENT
jgi:NTP pyrophosphatase (non-canonical NTP hydrolase)